MLGYASIQSHWTWTVSSSDTKTTVRCATYYFESLARVQRQKSATGALQISENVTVKTKSRVWKAAEILFVQSTVAQSLQYMERTILRLTVHRSPFANKTDNTSPVKCSQTNVGAWFWGAVSHNRQQFVCMVLWDKQIRHSPLMMSLSTPPENCYNRLLLWGKATGWNTNSSPPSLGGWNQFPSSD